MGGGGTFASVCRRLDEEAGWAKNRPAVYGKCTVVNKKKVGLVRIHRAGRGGWVGMHAAGVPQQVRCISAEGRLERNGVVCTRHSVQHRGVLRRCSTVGSSGRFSNYSGVQGQGGSFRSRRQKYTSSPTLLKP